MKTDRDRTADLLFGVRRSVRYHLHRRRWFDRVHRLIQTVTLAASSAAVAALLGAWGWETYAAAAAAAAAAGAVVAGPDRRAREHGDLAREFIGLEREMTLGRCNPARLAEWTARRLEIEAAEPPVLRVLDAICHDELIRAGGYDAAHHSNVSWVQRALADVIDVGAGRLDKRRA